ncbi:MAG: hypothetical protein AAFX87_23730 [Bacteroidota bacterium]
MSESCQNKNLVARDGTSQQQRLYKALLPSYVAVDERKIEDLKTFVLEYAEEIQYYNLSNDPDGDWVNFFLKQKDVDVTEPHYALFLAFLELFKIAQNDLNTLTKRHLDFYYKDVLQLEEEPAVPDQVFIIFELAKHLQESLVNQGTRLKGKKDALGNNVFYELDSEIVVNKAKVSQIKAVLKDDTSILYASPQANSADGEGAEIETDIQSWETFGDTTRTKAEIGFAIASPVLFMAEGTRTVTIKIKYSGNIGSGFIHSNLEPAFRMLFSGEEKWIEPLTFEDILKSGECDTTIEKRVLDFLNRAKKWQDIAGVEPQEGPIYDDPTKGYGDQIRDYDIGKTTATKMLEFRNKLPDNAFVSMEQVRSVKGVGQDKMDDLIYSFREVAHCTQIDTVKKEITLIRTIGMGQEAIVAYNEEALKEPFKTKWPVMKVLFNPERAPFIYQDLIDLKLEKAEVKVDVSEVRDLIIQNDQSVMDPSKTFLPFGINPVIGSNFYIGSNEIFQKQLDFINIDLEWHGLPAESGTCDIAPRDIPSGTTCFGFNYHYKNYIGDSRDNTSFQVDISLLDARSWEGLGNFNLFKEADNQPLTPPRSITISNAMLAEVERDEEMTQIDQFDVDTQKGFLRLELANSDFGHANFQSSFTQRVLENIENTTNAAEFLPKTPYNPTIKSISVDYVSTAEVDFTLARTENSAPKVEQYFHVLPFGVSERERDESATRPYLAPQFRDEGELYIGLENLNPAQNISLLFRMAEGSGDPTLEIPNVVWSYLSENEWIPFEQFDIISDSTNGLITSGIVKFSVSKKASKNNTALPSDLHWLRATVLQDTGAIPDTIGVIAQAVVAKFQDNNNDPNFLAESLAAETIKKLEVSDSAIDKLSQPYASFGGKIKEQSIEFYTRISERLRHKSRAVTIWDYERLVLEQFPSTYKVKCLNHTRFESSNYSEVAPGHVSVVVISNVSNQNAVDPLRPKTSVNTLAEINTFLSALNTDSVVLHVKNPIYEEIKVDFKVRLRQGFDIGFYGKKLEEDIKQFLSPWAFSGSQDITFGGRIHKSVILNFVEERPYVDYITNFKMYHKYPASTDFSATTFISKEVDEAVASTAASILGSIGQISTYGDHVIHVLEEDDCGNVVDNVIDPPPTIVSADECPCEDEPDVFRCDEEEED